ncbi:hypothetical protein K435DRAFT_691498 [Dendrothele bispora CBS 962.96]|uniref:DUF6589 domain-containing protein n=1 Tax=Dendrothele bispora (strain CBS 962.96) TaxID=1314807 RepID=A0A4S8L1U1_DENBC|nr:hypothetical protein K435DRAFT_691498 [Dendrothele bispora CBS 962.96]
MDIDCNYPEQLLGQHLLTFPSPLASPAQIISKDSSTPLSPTSTLNDTSFSPPSTHFNQTLSALEISHPLKPKSSHKRKRSAHERLLDDLENIDQHLQSICSDFGSLGNFLRLLFWHPRVTRNEDLCYCFHKRSICNFLQGKSSVKPVHIIRKIYSHPNSYPSWQSNNATEEAAKAFSLDLDPATIKYARPSLSAWAAQTCATRAHRELNRLTKNDPNHPEDTPARISIDSVTWDEINSITPARTIATFKRRAPYVEGLFRYLAEPRKSGKPIPQVYRPTDIVIGSPWSSGPTLVIGHNRFANGYLGLPLGIELFSTQTHSDIKRILTRMGLSISDQATRRALQTMTAKARDKMLAETVKKADKGEVARCYMLDNVQRNYAVHEGGLLVKPVMKVGCAATAVKLEDCEEGAWDLSDYLSRVAQNRRSTMTIHELWNGIDWQNHYSAQTLYRFRAHPVAIHRIPNSRRTKIQPLGTNSEREVEIHSMKRCIKDFDAQIGFTAAGADDSLLEWVGGNPNTGDGASFAAILNLQKYLAPTSLGNRETLRNKIVTLEIWHAKDKAMKAIAEEHFGPPSSSDPSSLSKLYTVAGLKRPSNPKQCDHYPTLRGFEMIWIAQILDCWRLVLGVEDLQAYFSNLDTNLLPSLDTLMSKAGIVVQKYASVGGYNRVISSSRHSGVKIKELRVELGTPWVSSSVKNPSPEQSNQPDSKMTDVDSFDGDRSLANSILFKMQFGSLLLLRYAIQDGDVGRVIQQLKVG